MAAFQIPPFARDSRANRVTNSVVTLLTNSQSAIRWLYLCGPQEAAVQVEMAAKNLCVPSSGHSEFMAQHTHCYEFDQGVPDEILDLVEILKEALSLAKRDYLDFALALDWYKIPDSAVEPKYWPNTEIGEMIYRGKYWSDGLEKIAARQDLLQRVASMMDRHPLFRNARCVVTVPGSNADGNSFGERLAGKVAEITQKELIRTECTIGARPPRKEGGGRTFEDIYKVSQSLTDDVVIIDDVYRSGMTMSAVALAARRAGAKRVFGFAAVRTMRN
ncbi:phosphoribosyltransferase [Actinomadura welshii]|uniref:phosphoribosyltransferase n=1 Tax=Actinomadura welshii TaxID=3103817 RepID=UPI001268A52A|nr:phosphoribosyltransferase [Actinomadura madurae]